MTSLNLFGEVQLDSPKTEGVKFIGAKTKLIPHILKLAHKTGAHSVLDGFSGTTRVSQAFAQCGYQVMSNDISAWSEVFGTCYLLSAKPRDYYRALIGELNNATPVDGWFTQNYGGYPNGGSSVQPDGLKKPWQIHNTRKLDGVRQKIEQLSLAPVEKAVAVTSLILGLDKVDNTLGHYCSYLKNWSPRSYSELELAVPSLVAYSDRHSVTRNDVFDLIDADVDLVYLDPPYGSNNDKMPPSRVRYSAYYHLWTTICRNDFPNLFGKAKRRVDTSDKCGNSVFEEFRRNGSSGKFICVEAIDDLLERVRARWVILSYSSGGRATARELDDMLAKSGSVVDVVRVDHKRNVMASMKWTNRWTDESRVGNQEFLFLIDRD
ncbi:DNA adenine methylase [Candidatus Poriferisodalis sp.]|uniref:DNA adenine methylase n=1 Tax=Candidatus Poriferisodalis sp. TaxID=3101277 RepID=UPI003AF7EF52